MTRPVLVSGLLLLATIGYVELRLPVSIGAQGGDAVYQRISVTSPAGGALRVAGGATLGLDLEPEYGGVADRTVVLVNATACPDTARRLSLWDSRARDAHHLSVYRYGSRATRERAAWNSDAAMNPNLLVVMASALAFLILVLSGVAHDAVGAAVVGAVLTLALLVTSRSQ